MESVTKKLLPEEVQKWVVNSINPKATIETISQLKGGISSLVFNVGLMENGGINEYVVRLHFPEGWNENSPDLVINEAENLRFTKLKKLPTPEIIAIEETGNLFGSYASIMTKLEGKVVLEPDDMKSWLSGLAQALVQIHRIKADFSRSYYTYQDPYTFEIPAWSGLKEEWKKVHTIIKGERPEFQECFIHRDYHPNNVLWSGNSVSGIVDWINACKGPAGVDVGHCRVNLAQLYGVKEADIFLSYYQQYAGPTFEYNPYWDIISLVDFPLEDPEVYPGWTDLGFKGLTAQLIKERLDAYMVSLVNRF
ncbi:aminoglycoside phosphotransferase family protein [Lederbergia wuyishanensis]|uniref:Aminoglycoside phosphotransferase (APT) family kinase protein n=1 Tax=Lederbergia wuyishanensis TaxID=1347903 RepID=A0ABU0DB23_9BACI|nr:aminoglycoside phosphotransferase family protein [Lederbergia wuyishanensis]MCJ8010076.1 aminoglycoside phosphotransferase family protein [Lederbergia wuyishanensis]MDQ0345590.1 aminoglycoside phosphotransferase (APT) family kinase protein [Lederbergia wuyishanensis]